jgi:tetratricopeptide (TPR) repeat protein
MDIVEELFGRLHLTPKSEEELNNEAENYCVQGQLEKFKQMLENKKIDPLYNEGSFAILSVSFSHNEILKFLYENYPEIKNYQAEILKAAINKKNIEAIEFLLDKGADPTELTNTSTYKYYRSVLEPVLFDKQLEEFVKIRKGGSENIPKQTFLKIGDKYLRRQELDKAKDCYLAALDKDKKYSTAYLHLGEAFAKDKNPEEALKNFKEAIECKPKYPYAFLKMGDIYSEKDYAAAKDAFKTAIQMVWDNKRTSYLSGFKRLFKLELKNKVDILDNYLANLKLERITSKELKELEDKLIPIMLKINFEFEDNPNMSIFASQEEEDKNNDDE